MSDIIVTVTSGGTSATANVNYGAEIYAERAKTYATQAGTSATLAGNYEDMCEAWYGSVTSAGTSATSAIATATTNGLSSISTATTEGTSLAIGSINSTTTASLGSITTATTSGTGSISSATTDGITSIQAQGTSSVGSVSSAGTSAVGSVSSATTESLGSITTATTNAVSSVNSAKTSALSTITASGTNIISSATAQATIATQQAALAKQYAEETHGQSDVMVENVRAIPAYTNYTYNQTETKGLADLKAWNRSTFDLSKFTVVGSPTITDNGIASGFSASNQIYYDTITLGNNFKIKGMFIRNNVATLAQRVFNLGSGLGLACILDGENYQYFQLFITGTDGSVIATYDSSLNKAYAIDTPCYFEFSYNGVQYELKTSNDNINFTSVYTKSSSIAPDVNNTRLYIGSISGSYSPFTNGSIDLKQFSITVDGKEVFNGNKTGIDQIKANDYTVVGSPTITDDGIASGFGTSNYIKRVLTNYSWNNWEINIDNAQCTTTGVIQELFDIYGAGGNRISLGKAANGQFQLAVTIDNTSVFNEYFSDASTITAKVGYDGTKYYWTVNGISDTLTSATTLPQKDYTVYFGVWYYLTGGALTDGSIDLNSFKIYTYGNLAYQPTLRIPYNQSKTGCKIVNSYYRDKVEDMYEQFGWANYYTLSDTNFKVPQGENLDGHIAKIDWYKNGTTSWEYDTNLDCVETGYCTSGTAVTLPKAFSDTNYSLSVPYSAKTATGFTPSATGEYIAKGKVVLG